MRRLLRLLLNLIGVAMAGLCVAFLLLVGATITALAAGATTIPGVVTVTRGIENGTTALTFTPNSVGFLVVAVASTVLLFVVQVKGDRRQRAAAIV